MLKFKVTVRSYTNNIHIYIRIFKSIRQGKTNQRYFIHYKLLHWRKNNTV